MVSTLLQVLSIFGAILILTGYAGQQTGHLRAEGLGFGALNLVGSSLLAASAVTPPNFGVLFVESAWAVLSLSIVVRALWRRASVTTERIHSGTGAG